MSFNVMIVDDSGAMRAVIKKVITISGFKISTVFRGRKWPGSPGKTERKLGGCHHFRHEYAGNERLGAAAVLESGPALSKHPCDHRIHGRKQRTDERSLEQRGKGIH